VGATIGQIFGDNAKTRIAKRHIDIMTGNVNSYAQILNGPSQLDSIKTYNDLAASLSEYNNEVKAMKASVQAEKKKANAEKAANKVRRDWRKLPRKVSYKCTFGAPDQGQMLDVWESQTSESALRWLTCHIAPCHILELTLEVILEVILEHVLGIKTMASLILDRVATAYLYIGISTEEKVMILLLSHSLGVVTGQNKTW
jgi:hypothetical protein